MNSRTLFSGLPNLVSEKPLQATKFGGILLSLVLGFAGFFRIIDAKAIISGPVLGDGQFLALLLIPLVSIALVFLVFLETLVTGYRIVRSTQPLTNQLKGRLGYVFIRGAEAGVAIIGLVIIVTALPPLVADSTPAPAGVGLMLLMMAVGIGILLTSFVRSGAELFVY